MLHLRPKLSYVGTFGPSALLNGHQYTVACVRIERHEVEDLRILDASHREPTASAKL
jgi:hypothetical protein